MFNNITPLEQVLTLEDLKNLFAKFWEDSLVTKQMRKKKGVNENAMLRFFVESGRYMELNNIFSLLTGRFITQKEIEKWHEDKQKS